MTYPAKTDALIEVSPTQLLALGHSNRHNDVYDAAQELREQLDTPPQNVRTGAYTFALSDIYALTVMNAGSAVAATISASVDWPDGAQLAVLNIGSAAATVTAGSGVTLRGSGSVPRYTGGVAINTAADTWTFLPFPITNTKVV